MKRIDGFDRKNLHFTWSANTPPICEIKSGETLELLIPDSSTMQIKPNFTTEDLKKIDESQLDGAVGPIKIEGAFVGEMLKVEILDIAISEWGWSAILPNFGFIQRDMSERLVMWDIRNNYAVSKDKYFLSGIEVPLSPFLGVTGTAPSDGNFGMIPPEHFGGNMDNRLLKAGSTLYLPINVDGGMISFSDPHASQGDGEVCGTAIEVQAKARIMISVEKHIGSGHPWAISPGLDEGPVILTMGINPDLKAAAIESIEDMFILLNAKYGLSREESYVLSSVAGSLKISEVVDMPNYVVSLSIPVSVFKRR